MLSKTIFRALYAPCVQQITSGRFCSNDPGARRRLEISKEIDFINETDPDDLDFEPNFQAFGKSHREHEEELKTMREKLHLDIVKQKYFKTKYPNFLTWHDKEQIRLLHKKDPEEWNIGRLSEGFPALPEIIKKVIKAKWRMDSVEKMKKHDETVMENWRKLKNKEYTDLPPNLLEHLNKFTNRKINHQNYEDIAHTTEIEYKPKLTRTDFSDIITSYEELRRKKEEPVAIEAKKDTNATTNKESKSDRRTKKLKKKPQLEEDTFLTEPIKNSSPMTLDTLREKLVNDQEKGKTISPEDVTIIELKQKDLVQATSETSQIDQLDYTKYNTGKLLTINEKKPRDYDHLVYPEKINIPKKILKKGNTYKLNDCFYHSDGTFLYRVPGMS